MKSIVWSVIAACLTSGAFGYDSPVTVTSVTGHMKVLESATVSFAAAETDRLLFIAWDEADQGDDINSWRRFRRVTVPAGATTATLVPYEPIDTATSKVKFFFAPTDAAPYDTTVEYVEATGTQYVDTGVYANGKKTAVWVDCAFTKTGTIEDTIFGAVDGNNITAPLNFHFNFRLNLASKYSFNCKDISHNNGIEVKNSTDRLNVTLDSPGRLLKIDDKTLGETVHTYAIPSEWPHNNTATRTMTIFADNGKAPACNLAHAKLYALKIYEAAISTSPDPIHSYVPVVSDGIGYLWDSVASVRCETLGTGNLIASTTLGVNATVTGAAAASAALDTFPPASPSGVTVSTMGGVETSRTINYTITSPGFGGASLKTEILYSLNADYTEATRVTVDAAYAGDFPYANSHLLTGLSQGVPYYSKFIITAGSEEYVTPFEFECPIVANRKCVWNVTDGLMGLAANWKVGDAAADYPPGEYDNAVFGGSGAKKVTLAHDQIVSNFFNAVTTANGGADGTANVTCDLNGHTLWVRKSVTTGHTWIYGAGQLTFTNGNVAINGNLNAGSDSTDWRCGTINLLGPALNVSVGGNFSGGGYGHYSGYNVKGGAVVDVAGNLTVASGGQKASYKGGPSFANICGDGTRVTAKGYLSVSQYARMFVSEGAELSTYGYNESDKYRYVPVGNYGSYSELIVDDATTTIHGYPLVVGIAAHWVDNARQVAAHNTVEVRNGGQLVGAEAAYIEVGHANSAACTTNNRLRVTSGGIVDLRSSTSSYGVRVSNGGNPGVTRCHGQNGVEVDGGVIYAPAMVVGVSESRSNNWLNVSGKASKIVLSDATSLQLNYHSTVRFTLDEEGFDETPIQCAGEVKATQSATLQTPSEIVIDARAFARKHAQTSVTLIEAGKDSTAALEELRDNATFVYPANKPWLGGELSVVDGKKLVLTTFAHPGMALIVR